MVKNPCIEITTIKGVVEGRIRGEQQGSCCHVKPWREDGVELHIYHQTFSKSDPKHLIVSLGEIHEVLSDNMPKVKVTKTDCNCAQCKSFEKDVR